MLKQIIVKRQLKKCEYERRHEAIVKARLKYVRYRLENQERKEMIIFLWLIGVPHLPLAFHTHKFFFALVLSSSPSIDSKSIYPFDHYYFILQHYVMLVPFSSSHNVCFALYTCIYMYRAKYLGSSFCNEKSIK